MIIWPRVLPDESLFSIFSHRQSIVVRNPSVEGLQEFFGRRLPLLSTGFPTGLNHLAHYLEPTGAWSLDRLVDTFTFIPYVIHFYPPKTVQRIRKTIVTGDGRGVKTLLGWVASRLGAYDSLRGCPVCAREDFDRFGRPYWHRSHQLPSVSACAAHAVCLVRMDVPTRDSKRFNLAVPDPHLCEAACVAARPQQTRFAEWSDYFLNHSSHLRPVVDFRSIYVECLRDLDLVTPGGRIRQRDYEVWLRSKIERDVDCNLGWVAKLVRKPRGTLHPRFHISLLMALFPGPADFLRQTKSSATPFTPEDGGGSQKQSETLRQSRYHVSSSPETTPLACVQQSGVEFHVPSGALRVLARDGRITQLIGALLQSGSTVQHICAQTGLSQVSIYRFLRRSPSLCALRRASLREKNAESRIAMIRECLSGVPPPTRAQLSRALLAQVTWLRRNAPNTLAELFEQCSAPSKDMRSARADWQVRDHRLRESLLERHRSLIATDSKPVRLTVAELLRGLPVIDSLYKRRDMFPLTWSFLRDSIDSDDSFFLRRVTWAAFQLRDAGATLTRSGLVRYAGVRDRKEISLATTIGLFSAEIRPPSASMKSAQ